MKGFLRNKRRVSSLVLKIRNRVNSTKRTKKTLSEDLEILRNCKVPIKVLPVYYIWGL